MKVVVTGSRNATSADAPFVRKALTSVNSTYKITGLAHGNASGIDDLAGTWASDFGVPLRVFEADWEEYGKAAGPIRNREMIETFAPQLVLAFPDPKTWSQGGGTFDCVKAAVEHGIFVRIYPLTESA